MNFRVRTVTFEDMIAPPLSAAHHDKAPECDGFAGANDHQMALENDSGKRVISVGTYCPVRGRISVNQVLLLYAEESDFKNRRIDWSYREREGCPRRLAGVILAHRQDASENKHRKHIIEVDVFFSAITIIVRSRNDGKPW